MISYSQYNFYCLNFSNCDLSRKKVITLECVEGEENEQLCPECGELLKCVGRPSTVTPLLKFHSKSVEDKKKILKKRSHDHFKKEIEEKKRDMDKNYW